MPLIEIEEDHLVTQVGDIVPAEMDDEELRECLAMLCVEVADIEAQLKNPLRYCDKNWFFRAQDALRFRIREFESCRSEAMRRGLSNFADIDPEREARRRKVELGITEGQLRNAELQVEVQWAAEARHAAREAVKAARHRATQALNNARYTTRAPCFLAAATRILSKEQRAEIWALARVLFPDSPGWADDNSEAT